MAKLEQLLQHAVAGRDVEPLVGPHVESRVESHVEKTPRSTTASTEDSLQTKMTDVETWRAENAQPNKFVLPHRPRPSTTYMGSSFWDDLAQHVSTIFAFDPCTAW